MTRLVTSCVAASAMGQAELPADPAPDPHPPTPDEAARLVAEAGLVDPDPGRLWVAHVGHRRAPAESCAACGWSHVDLDRAVVMARRAIAQNGTETEEKDTKTHQRRHVTVDPGTVDALREHRQRWVDRCSVLGARAVA